MADSSLGEALRLIRSALASHGLNGLGDQQLLDQFLTQRDPRALTVLVEHHGPMILSVCRRILGNVHIAEDAFQAVFLVLLRKKASFICKQSVGAWLHGVSLRIALRARAQSGLRRQKERGAIAMSSTGPLDELTLQELRSVLDEEIASLSEKYQGPLVLCHLEGKTYDDAARELGCTKITLSRRLAKARALFRTKLERRGITLTVAALATALPEAAQATPLPAFLALNTVKAATLVATGKTAAGGCLSAGALALAAEALTGMLVAKGKLVVVVIAVGLALGGAGWAGYKVVAEARNPGPGTNAQVAGQKKQVEAKVKSEAVAVDQYGDPLPEGALARLGSIHWRHGSSIINSALSPDGKLLATVADNSVVVWELATGRRVHKFLGDDNYSFQIPGVEFSRDGRRLVYTQHPGFAAVWDLKSGKEVRLIQDPERYPLTGPSHFTPDGEGLILTQKERTETINLSTGKETHSTPVGNIFQISADGKSFLREEGKRKRNAKREILLGDLLTGTTKVRVEVGPDLGYLHPGLAYAVLAPDGKSVAIAQCDLSLIELRDTVRGEVQATFKMGEPFINFGFTADGKTLWFSGGTGVLHRWDLESRKELAPLGPSEQYLAAYHELADNTTAITTRKDGWIQHWDRQTGRAISKEEGYFGVTYADFSPDGSLIAVADSRGRMDLWDAVRGTQIKTLRETGPRVLRLAFAPDGKHLGTVEDSGKLQLWDISTGKPARVLLERIEIIMTSPTEATLLFSRDGRFVFFGVPFGVAHLLEISSGKKIWSSKGPHAAALSSDGRKLIAAVGGTKLTYFDWETGKELKKTRITIPDGFSHSDDGWAIFSMAAAPDGRRLAFGVYSGQIALLDHWKEPRLETYLLKPQTFNGLVEEIGRHMQASSSNVSSRMPGVKGLAFTPDGNWLVSGRTNDSKVRVNEFLTGQEVVQFQGHDGGIMNVAVSPDGRKVLSCSFDGQVYLWDLRPTRSALPRKQMSALWADLASKDARQAYLTIWSLVEVPKESVSFLQGKLKPVPVAEKIQRWIADLDSETFAVRQEAARELGKAGDQIVAPIQKALQGNPSLETRRRLEQVLKNLPDVPSLDTLRIIRAIMALERIGSPEAQSVLEALARGAPGVRETEEATASLERLRRR